MAVTKFLARDITVQVKIASVYTHIGGIATLAHSPAKTTADATDFDDNGRARNIVVQRGDQWTLSGHFLEDVSTGLRDAGQEELIDLGQAIGLSGTGSFKLTSPGGNTVTFDATVDITGPAGGHNDLATFQAVLEVSGAVVYSGPAS